MTSRQILALLQGFFAAMGVAAFLGFTVKDCVGTAHAEERTAMAAQETASKPETITQPTAKWATFRLGVRIAGTVAFPDGETTPKPIGTALGFNMTNPTGLPWLVWTSEVGAGSPMIVFNPSPYAFTGPVFIVLPGQLTINPWVTYQWNPGGYSAAKGVDTHYMGGGITPGFPITKEITFALPVGAGVTLGGPKKIASFNIGPKLVFLLPF